jgi:hypothetical protein
LSLIGTCGWSPAGKVVIALMPYSACMRFASRTASMPVFGSTWSEPKKRFGWFTKALRPVSVSGLAGAHWMPHLSISSSVTSIGSRPLPQS